nr:hypothetical protein [Tanacetum cinerariifolium]
MSSASSAVTYTSIYINSVPGRVFWGADEKLSEGEDGPVDYPMDGGDDGEDDDGDSSGDDTDDEDENEEDEEEKKEEHLAPADSAVGIPTDELVSLPEGTEPAVISFPLEAEVERLLAMPTLSPSPLTSLSPPSAGERLARCTAPATLPSPLLPPPLHMPPPIDRREDIPETEIPPRKRLCLSTLGSRIRSGYDRSSPSMKLHQWRWKPQLHEDNRRNVQTARPCFYADFMKCQPLNFRGTEGMVMFATCTLLDVALTWWNSQIRSLGPDACSMTWEVLKKKMTDKYCPRGEIKKLEIKLWNLNVKENNVSAYIECFQELTLICTKFVADETEKIDKYVSGLLDNFYGCVKDLKPKTLDETIELANNLMDQKLRTYAERQVYNIGTGKKKLHNGNLPKCTKCHFHHNRLYTQKWHKCNKVGHFARHYRSSGNANVVNAQRNNGANPKENGCFECGAIGHFKMDCPKLKNKDGKKVNAPGWVYAVGNTKKREHASRDPDSNVVTGNSYDDKLADGKIVEVDTIMRSCTLNFLGHPFNIDLMPVELGKGDDLRLVLDQTSGPGIQSKRAFLFGSIEMLIKLVPGNSAGTVTAYYENLTLCTQIYSHKVKATESSNFICGLTQLQITITTPFIGILLKLYGMLIVFQSESLETIKVNGLHTKTNKGCSELELISGTDLLASAGAPFHSKPTGGHLLFTSN